MSIAAILEEGQQVAASLFDEKEYVTKFGSTGDEDPWDESAVDKDGWVQVMVDTVAKHLPQPPVTFDKDAPVEPDKLGRISKSLNLGRGYAEHWEKFSCRELVQNWFDACVETCGGGKRDAIEVVTTNAPARGLAAGAGGIIYFAMSGGKFAGYLADYEANDGTRSVDLVNYGGMITVDAMVLGNSSKRGQSGATGFFGEGVKVEINRLTASGVAVLYTTPVNGSTTHHAKWAFSYEAEKGGAAEVLHLHMESGEGPSNGVHVRARGLPRGSAAIDPNNFLFLQGGYTKASAPPGKGATVAGIDVLLDKRHEGKIYIGGIFALPWGTLRGVGLDYTGGGDSFKHVGLGRDRTSVHVHELIGLLPSALAHEKSKPVAGALLERIFDTLQDAPHSEMAWIRDCPFDGPLTKQARDWWLEFADALVALFKEKHGALAVPCESHEMSLAKEAEGMGALPITVSFPLKKTLEGSEGCPTMARLRSDFYDSMLRIPDVDMADNRKMIKIRDNVVTFFNEVKKDRTHFKRPKAGNQRLVVPVGDEFVIDVNLFELDRVHRAQAAAGQNICIKTDCGCQSLALVKGFTDAIAGADDHRKGQLEQRVLRALLEDSHKGGGGGSGGGKKEADEGESDDDAAPPDMLSMLMGSAVSESSDESGDEVPKPAAAKRTGGGARSGAVASASTAGAAAAPSAAPPPPPAGPSRPPAPRVEIDLRSSLKAGAVARLMSLAKRIAKKNEGLAAGSYPPDLVCPITAEVFVDPVLAADGFTYEKDALKVWFLDKSTSPATGHELESKDTFPNKAVESLLAALKSGAASLPTGGGGRANGGGGDSSDEEYVAPKPKPKAKSRDDDLGSLYMSRKPTGEAASILNGGPPKPRPRPSARPAAAPAGDGGGMDESAFMAWRGGDGDAPAPSRPKPSTRVERTRVERAEEPAEGDDAPKKKKGWSVFSKKS